MAERDVIHQRRRAREETSAELMHKPELTVAEVAELFGMSSYVIHAAIYHHELPATLLGHDVICIKRADLLAWLERRK
ncbi:MAG TPA: helix-turn-helix domain-containing protein [Thermomicrobiales bacterium]|nr:helix-turn-helix domain-containing protein [Thermomicrobiales bacterium]